MLVTLAVILLLLTVAPTCVRGHAFHNLLVETAAREFRQAGCVVKMEHGVRLPDGRTDYLDLLVRRDTVVLGCEIETTARNVAVNVNKANAIDLPLWIVVPNRTVRIAVRRELDGLTTRSDGPFQILLPGQLRQALALCFPFLSFPNGGWEREK